MIICTWGPNFSAVSEGLVVVPRRIKPGSFEYRTKNDENRTACLQPLYDDNGDWCMSGLSQVPSYHWKAYNQQSHCKSGQQYSRFYHFAETHHRLEQPQLLCPACVLPKTPLPIVQLEVDIEVTHEDHDGVAIAHVRRVVPPVRKPAVPHRALHLNPSHAISHDPRPDVPPDGAGLLPKFRLGKRVRDGLRPLELPVASSAAERTQRTLRESKRATGTGRRGRDASKRSIGGAAGSTAVPCWYFVVMMLLLAHGRRRELTASGLWVGGCEGGFRALNPSSSR